MAETDTATLVSLLSILATCFVGLLVYIIGRKQALYAMSQNELNKQLLLKERQGFSDSLRAELQASLVRISGADYAFEVVNQGKGEARNVNVAFLNGSDLFSDKELATTFPYELLGSGQTLHINAYVHLGTVKKHSVRLIWSDNHKENNEKVVWITL